MAARPAARAQTTWEVYRKRRARSSMARPHGQRQQAGPGVVGETEDGGGCDGDRGAAADQAEEHLVAAAGLGGDGLGVERGGCRIVVVGAGVLSVGLGLVPVGGPCVVDVLVRGALRGGVADGQAGEAGGEAGEEGDEADGHGGADGGGVGGGGLGGDGHEGGDRSGGGDEGGRDEGGVTAGSERDQGDGGDQGADAAEQELEAAGAVTEGRSDDPGAA